MSRLELKFRESQDGKKIFRSLISFSPFLEKVTVAGSLRMILETCPDLVYRGERAQRRGCRKPSGFLSRETGISGNFVGRIKGAKCPFDLQFLTWDFS